MTNSIDGPQEIIIRGASNPKAEILGPIEDVSVDDYVNALSRVEEIKGHIVQRMWDLFREIEDWKVSQGVLWIIPAGKATYAYRHQDQQGEARILLIGESPNGLLIRQFVDEMESSGRGRFPGKFLGATTFSYKPELATNRRLAEENDIDNLMIGYTPSTISPEYWIGGWNNPDYHAYAFGWHMRKFLYKQGETDYLGQETGIQEHIDPLKKGKEEFKVLSSAQLLGLWSPDGSIVTHPQNPPSVGKLP